MLRMTLNAPLNAWLVFGEKHRTPVLVRALCLNLGKGLRQWTRQSGPLLQVIEILEKREIASLYGLRGNFLFLSFVFVWLAVLDFSEEPHTRFPKASSTSEWLIIEDAGAAVETTSSLSLDTTPCS